MKLKNTRTYDLMFCSSSNNASDGFFTDLRCWPQAERKTKKNRHRHSIQPQMVSTVVNVIKVAMAVI